MNSIFGDFTTIFQPRACQESNRPSSNLTYDPRHHLNWENIQKKATIWFSLVEIALFQHHACTSSPPPPRDQPIPIDKSYLNIICISLKFLHASIVKRSIRTSWHCGCMLVLWGLGHKTRHMYDLYLCILSLALGQTETTIYTFFNDGKYRLI